MDLWLLKLGRFWVILVLWESQAELWDTEEV
jgi:hypothetical protein